MKLFLMARLGWKPIHKYLWGGLIAIFFTCGAILLSKIISASYSEPVVAMGRWVPVTAQAQTFELVSPGKLVPIRLIEVSASAGGTLQDVKAAWGDAVLPGQSLVRIDSPELESQLRTAVAAALRSGVPNNGASSGGEPEEVIRAKRRLVSAQAALQSATGRAADSEVLLDKGFISRLDKESAVAEAKNAQEQVFLAGEELRASVFKYTPGQLRASRMDAINRETEVMSLRQRQNLLHVVAPFAGVVLPPPRRREDSSYGGTRELAQGAKVNNGDAVLVIGDTSSYLVQASCSETDLAWLELGLPARVIIAAIPDQIFEAQVSRLGAALQGDREFGARSGKEFECEFFLMLSEEQSSNDIRRRLRVGGTAAVNMSHTGTARQTAIAVSAVSWMPDGQAKVRWRSSASAPPKDLPVQIVRADLSEVLLRVALQGEVWVPADSAVTQPAPSVLSRLFGADQ